jgi:hypothetical protein
VFEVSAFVRVGGQSGTVPPELQKCAESGYPYVPEWAERLTTYYDDRHYPLGEERAIVEGKSTQLMFALQRLVAIGASRKPEIADALAGIYAIGQFAKDRAEKAHGDDALLPSTNYRSRDVISERVRRNLGRFQIARSTGDTDSYHLIKKLRLVFDALTSVPPYGSGAEARLLLPGGSLKWLEASEFIVERIDESTVAVTHAEIERLRVIVIMVDSLASAVDVVLGRDAELLIEPPHARPWTLVASLSLGAGELVWWPYLAGKYGWSRIVPLVVISAMLQWPLNYVIGCHAVATKETLLVGLWRVNAKLGLFNYALFTVAFVPFAAYAYFVGRAISSLGTPILVNALPTQMRGDTPGAIRFWSVAAILVAAVCSAWEWKRPRVRESKCIWILGAAAFVVTLCAFGAGPDGPGPKAPFSDLFDPVGKASLSDLFDPSNDDFVKMLGAFIFMGLGGFWNTLYSVWLIQADAAGELGDPGQVRAVLRRDSAYGVVTNLGLTIMLCLLAHRFLEIPAKSSMDTFDVLTAQATGVTGGWHLGVIGWSLYLCLVVLVLWDTLPITAHAVSGIHAGFLQALGKTRPSFAKAARLLGEDGRWGAVLMYAMSFLLVMVAIEGKFLPRLNLWHGHLLLLSMPICCSAMLLVGRRLWRNAPAGAASPRPEWWALASVWVATAVYVVLAIAAAFVNIRAVLQKLAMR